jgi:hypothetical protein
MVLDVTITISSSAREKTADASAKTVTIPRASMVAAVNILTGLSLDEKTEGSAPVVVKTPITVGRLLQLFGTDVGRNLFAEDIWVRALERLWRAAGGRPLLLTDVRLPNEVGFVESIGGSVYYVDAEKRLARGSGESKDGRSTTHISETAPNIGNLELLMFAAPVALKARAAGIIPNNGTREELSAYIIETFWPRLAERP